MSSPPASRHAHNPGMSGAEFPDATLKLLALLVEETSDILTAADINFRPITWNKASEKIYGLEASQVIGRDLREFLSIHYRDATRDQVREAINTRGEWRGEAWFRRPSDQKLVTLLIAFKQLKDENGKLIGHLINGSDISERKEAESRLRESEQRFREIADSSPTMISLTDEADKTIYTNIRWKEFTGNSSELENDTWSCLIHPHDKPAAIENYYKAVAQRQQVTAVYRLRRADGVYRWVHDTCVPRFLADGKFVGYLGSIVDIEDEKQKHEQLAYQATILENVSDIMISTDCDLKIKTWNKTAEQYFGISAQDALGHRLNELVQFQYPGSSEAQALQILSDKDFWNGEVIFSGDGGSVIYLHFTVKGVYNGDDEKIGYLSIGRDITENKIASRKLVESEVFYRTLIAHSMDGVLLMDLDGTIKFASPSVKNVLNYDVEELIGKNGFDFVHPEDRAWAAESFLREVNENPTIKSITVRLLTKDQQWLWCSIRGHNLLENPQVKSVVVHFHDDSARKQASDALKESEQRFRSLVRELQVGVFVCDDKGMLTMCNRSLSQMLSSTEEDLIGKGIYEIISEDLVNDAHEIVPFEERPVTKCIKTRQPVKSAVLGIQKPGRTERCWIMMNTDPILNEEGAIQHIVCSVMDITERKNLEEKLLTDRVQHQRQLTQATIDGQEKERREIGKELHDNIGQQLTTIKLFLDYAKTTADDATLEMINLALKGVSDVINDVRAMSRALVPYTLKDLGLIESIHEILEPLNRARVLQADFQYEGYSEGDLPENKKLTLFRIVQEQLNNIVKHASASNVVVKLSSRRGQVLLEIKDDGNGFDPRTIRKGLGIINISNRVELFNGKAEVSSKPGQGCTLRVRLPVGSNEKP